MPDCEWDSPALDGARVRSCRSSGCTLDVSGVAAESLSILDCERCTHLFGGGVHSGDEPRRCDFIIRCGKQSGSQGYVLAVVEMKQGGQAKEAIAQIRAGAAVADRLLGGAGISDFLPIVPHNRVHSMELRIFRKEKISFRGRSKIVILKSCGFRLKDLLR